MTLIDPTNLCQIQIAVSDIEAAIIFYSRVFGWEHSKAKLHDYYILDVPKECNFGISLILQNSALPNSRNTTLYFKSKNKKKVEELAVKYGGQVAIKNAIPGYGKMTFIEDPSGNTFGLMN